MTTQPSEPAAVPRVEDRRRRLAAIGIAVVCVVAVIVGGVFAYRAVTSADPKTDTELVDAQARGYLDDVSHADLRGASARMCQALGSVVSGGGDVPHLPSARGSVRKGTTVVDHISVDGDTATVDASVRYGSTSVPTPMTLRRESDGWCITDVG
ncbi:Rv0361 family membrane protein [Gordonia sp. MP11Mi]